MSDAGFALSGAITGLNLFADQPTPWDIGGIVPDAAFDEEATDELAVTEHPVEYNAAITDHVYKKPSRLLLRVGFSNSSAAATGGNGFLNVIPNSGNQNYVQAQYAALLAMQVSGQTISVTTGKRSYSNMVIESLSQTTDETTPQVLVVTIGLREIILAQTAQNALPPNGNMQNPQNNGNVQNQGFEQLIPA